ncbi:hypothetical protein PRJBM_01429 [Bartonella henselae]|uniref:Uncharacterized protein n=2 Tax=root TaxID=1 RepID=A0A0H3M6T6_BARHE|nr:hypothetical protein Q654_01447 [Bartonella henselae JK 50]ETS06071.1 hypothetical protein Q655_01395 [Bartonella henselae JK 51]ETS10936.1 hypothetical protein Q653_00470 [Bartonella henselae JK 42]ETS13793.1 hypothetical protein Q652_00603 [Bartonella henselae JK 41]CAF28222.1 hypothetical protein BH14580 [Bartonella henselae str. Houston-1]CDO40775.1 hypothetical protein PRJBM_01429 [Bartonella henselae]DBA12287.1 TPA_asm: hypothetical protein [Bartonegtaviriform andersoni]
MLSSLAREFFFTSNGKFMKTVKKRGRPRITGKPREPNGRISRAKRPNKAVPQVTIEMRAKHFGLSIEEAKNPLSSSYIGRLYMLGTKQNGSGINKEQYDTAQRYLQIRNDYLCAKGLPSGYYDNFTHALSDEKAKKQWVRRATDHYEEMQEAIKEAQQLHRQHNFHGALQYLVVEDQSLPSLVCSLRLILDALHKHFDG